MRRTITMALAAALAVSMAFSQDLYVRFNKVPAESGMLTGAQGSLDGKTPVPAPITIEEGVSTDAYLMDAPAEEGGVYTKTFTLPAGDYEYQVVFEDGTGTQGESTAWLAGRAFSVMEEQPVLFRAKVVNGYIRYLCEAQDLFFSPDSNVKNGSIASEPNEDGIVNWRFTRSNAYKNGKVEGFIYPGAFSTQLVADVLPTKGKYNFPGGAAGNVRWMLSYNRNTLDVLPLQVLVCLLDNSTVAVNEEPMQAGESVEHIGTFTTAVPLMLGGTTHSVSARVGVDAVAGSEKGSELLKIAPEKIEAKMYYNVFNADSTERVDEGSALMTTEADMAVPEYETAWALEEPMNVTDALASGDYKFNVWYETVCYGDTIKSAVHSMVFSVEKDKDPTTGLGAPALKADISTFAQTIQASFEGTARVKLYSVSGQLLDEQLVSNTYEKAVHPGIYVLSIAEKTYKVIVK